MADLFTLSRPAICTALDVTTESVSNWIRNEHIPMARKGRKDFLRLIDLVGPLRRNRARGLTSSDLAALIDADYREREERGLIGPNITVDITAAERLLPSLTPEEMARAEKVRAGVAGTLVKTLWTDAAAVDRSIATRALALPAYLRFVLSGDAFELPPVERETPFNLSFVAANDAALFAEAA